jgi:hypothetical protein
MLAFGDEQIVSELIAYLEAVSLRYWLEIHPPRPAVSGSRTEGVPATSVE